jgi:hypothetical protein
MRRVDSSGEDVETQPGSRRREKQCAADPADPSFAFLKPYMFGGTTANLYPTDHTPSSESVLISSENEINPLLCDQF